MKQRLREKSTRESQAESRKRAACRAERGQGGKLSGRGALIARPGSMGLISWVGNRETHPGREEET